MIKRGSGMRADRNGREDHESARSVLFRGAPDPRNPQYASSSRDVFGDETMRLMEKDNDEEIENLGHKVTALKDLSIDINAEVREQNRFLDDMEGGFGQTGVTFQDTLKRMGHMVKTASSKHMFLLILFIMFVFFVLYYWYKNR